MRGRRLAGFIALYGCCGTAAAQQVSWQDIALQTRQGCVISEIAATNAIDALRAENVKLRAEIAKLRPEPHPEPPPEQPK